MYNNYNAYPICLVRSSIHMRIYNVYTFNILLQSLESGGDKRDRVPERTARTVDEKKKYIYMYRSMYIATCIFY